MDSRLEEFEKKLYKPGAEEKKQESYEVYKEEAIGKKWGGWEEGGRPFGQAKRGRGLSIVLLFFVASLAVVGGYYWYTAERPFDQKSVQGEISGPARISSGDEVAFTVTYRNNADVSLRDTKMFFTWPEGAVLLDGTPARDMKADVGTIIPKQEKSVTFKGRMYGAKDETKEIAVSFQYTPETVASVFEDKKKITVAIAATPIAVTINTPAQVVSDKEVQIEIEYQNQSDAKFENMELRATYPEGFQPTAADPTPSPDAGTIWKLGTIERRAGGKVTVKGTFSGVQGESKSLYFEIGAKGEGEFLQYATADSVVTIASSALFVFQTVNDSRDYATNPSATLRYRIRYKNTTNIQIPNAVILAKIDETFVDVRTLIPQWGSFDGRTNSIIWNSVGVPELAVLDPKEEGEVSFSVTLRSSFLPKKFADKNFVVTSTARITAAASPESLSGLPLESEDTLSVKIHTQFSFNETAYYANGSMIQNSGPLPPRVGERTTFAISWQLSNTINDVDDVEVTAVVPPNVEWTGVVYPQDANIKYDPNSGVITWKPGKIFAGTGFLTPPKRVDFQVAFVPALVHVGQTINLVSAASLKAIDTFTALKMERQVPQVNSDLLNSLKNDEGRVMNSL